MKELITYKHKVQYYETDQMSIVHHSNYIRWFEEARIDFLEQIGMNMEEIERNGVQIPVLSVSSNYRSMVRFGDKVYVGLKIEKYNGIKLQISYRITDAKTNELRNEGESSHCFLDLNGQVISLIKHNIKMHETLEKYVNSSTF